jgi:prepilin-type N-terminal cleavage/methylation domain-containing protein
VGRRRFQGESGFTLPEVLLAAMIITIAFVTLLAVIPYSSAAVQSGSQISTATFLADQKLEEAKLVPWTATPANDCLGVSNGSNAPSVPGGGSCTLGANVYNGGQALPWAADQNATQITNFNGYSRTVRITDCGLGGGCTGITDSGMRQVTVSVTYTPGLSVSSTAVTSKTITATMIIAQR